MKKLVCIVTILIGLLTACGHEHIFSVATCTSPRTCRECGESVGTALGHSWSDATCEIPQKCSRCSETQGEALGHTTEVGVCKNCSEYQGKEIVKELLDNINKAANLYQNAENYIISNMYSEKAAVSAIKSKLEDFKTSKKYLLKAYDLCGDYKELSSIKSYIKAAAESVTVNYRDWNSWCDDTIIFVTKIGMLRVEAIGMQDDIGYELVWQLLN